MLNVHGTDKEGFDAISAMCFVYVPDLSNSNLCSPLLEQYLLYHLVLMVDLHVPASMTSLRQ